MGFHVTTLAHANIALKLFLSPNGQTPDLSSEFEFQKSTLTDFLHALCDERSFFSSDSAGKKISEIAISLNTAILHNETYDKIAQLLARIAAITGELPWCAMMLPSLDKDAKSDATTYGSSPFVVGTETFPSDTSIQKPQSIVFK